MRTGSDPISEDLAELDARADEDEREKRHAEFVLDIARWGTARVLRCATTLYDEGLPSHGLPLSVIQRIVLDFHESERWSGVFSAIALAIREHEQEDGDRAA